MGVGPTSQAWEARILPMYYTRIEFYLIIIYLYSVIVKFFATFLRICVCRYVAPPHFCGGAKTIKQRLIDLYGDLIVSGRRTAVVFDFYVQAVNRKFGDVLYSYGYVELEVSADGYV